MPKTQQQSTGLKGERIAAHFLQSKGFSIVETNAFKRVGEIDIVAEKESLRVFVEVKTKTSDMFGQPHEHVTEHKVKKIIRAAHIYNAQHPLQDKLYRIDVISILLNKDTHEANVQWFQNITQ